LANVDVLPSTECESGIFLGQLYNVNDMLNHLYCLAATLKQH